MRTIGAERPEVEVAVVLGVDTHLDFHVALAIDHLGRRMGEAKVPRRPRRVTKSSCAGLRASAT